jgi:hypothetical protein
LEGDVGWVLLGCVAAVWPAVAILARDLTTCFELVLLSVLLPGTAGTTR